ncbi:argininosuccinate lyase [Variovorax sp. J31P207]|uniref:argininosuccinate lyase n=1 Tax=Variovorax sp. J31P207 TaxID=3053510 RepID=UPI0025752344|nr:argininosuccinate lyase [Variovorax sp. J31P207]MDM0071591.1 argininosuccinate lyase [Variovorax sp. J31P207]
MENRDKPAATERLWGARFKALPSDALKALSRSEPSFFRLVPYDLAGSRAHAGELKRAGILDADELQALLREIDAVESGFKSGAIQPVAADEDVHTFLERILTERLGALGGKLRAGRSRNDQAANDLRLYLRDRARVITGQALELQKALVAQAREHLGTIASGFTHLQPAQPVLFAQQLMAHAQAIDRNLGRLADWDRRAARSPLGAAALAGSAICRNPELSAAELGYDAACENSIDAVAARDHVAEFLFATCMLAVELSRLAEETVLWSSAQFRWVELDDGYCTGSSIMPQKKNPDIAELTRGKAGRLIGNLVTMLSAIKSLPLSYNRDLAEDKAASFDTIDTLALVLPAMAGMIATMKVNVERVRRDATSGFTLATEVADWLALNGIPFSEAHEITGALVKFCEAHDIGLEDVTAQHLADVDTRLKPAILERLSLEAAIAARTGYGGTAPERVAEQLERFDARIAAHTNWASEYRGPQC